MALEPIQVMKTQLAAHKFINEALIAIIAKLHPSEPIATAIHSYVEDELKKTTVANADAEEFKSSIMAEATTIIGRGSNASK